MMPRPLYSLRVHDGTRLLLSLLYDDIDDDPIVRATVVTAWEQQQPGALPPFCYRFAGDKCKSLMAAINRGHTSVTDDLAALTKLGIIRRAKRDGRWGWELLGTHPSPPAGSAPPDHRVRPAGPQGPDLQTRGSAQPDPSTAGRVRSAGPPGPPHRTPGSVPPDPTRARVEIKQEPDLARRGGAANDRPPQGPARALLLDLARELDGMFTPRDAAGAVLESRRIRPDTDTLRRLAELLTPPEDVDVTAWIERQVATVRAYVRDYAAICGADPEQARQWGGDMLEPQIRKGVRSAWETLTRIVDRWREAQAAAAVAARDAAAEARRAEVRAVAERLAELEHLARVGEPALARELRAAGSPLAPPRRDHVADHAAAVAAAASARAAGREPTLADLNAAIATVPALGEGPVDTIATFLDSSALATSSVTPLPPLPPMQHVVGEPPVRELSDDEEAEIRERGRRREDDLLADDQTDEDEELRIGQRINAAFREFTETRRRSPTADEAEQIRRRARGEEEATGT